MYFGSHSVEVVTAKEDPESPRAPPPVSAAFNCAAAGQQADREGGGGEPGRFQPPANDGDQEDAGILRAGIQR